MAAREHDPIAGLKKKYPWLGSEVVPVRWGGEQVPVTVPAVWPARGCEGMVSHDTVRDLFDRGLAIGKDPRPIPKPARAWIAARGRGTGRRLVIEVPEGDRWREHAVLRERGRRG